jgi:hypothetical protein
MSLPGDLWFGCVSLGDAAELIEAFGLLREQEAGSYACNELASRQRALQLIRDAGDKALSSPGGKRVYPEATVQWRRIDGRTPLNK